MMSDCAVIFVDDRSRRNKNLEMAKSKNLNVLLWAISSINRGLINPNRTPQIMTTCAIHFGYFEYSKRTEDQHIQNNLFFGEAYLHAFLKTEEKHGFKKMPGYCKVIKRDFIVPLVHNEFLHNELSRLRESGDYYNHYWMTADPRQIDHFEINYQLITQSSRRKNSTYYREIIKLLYETSNKTIGNSNRDYKKWGC